MDRVIRRALAHVAPEELLLIPVVILVIVAVLAQPTAITRLFEGPYATPIPGDSPADIILRERTPAPAPSPVTMPASQDGITFSYGRQGELIARCPSGVDASPFPVPTGGRVLSSCVYQPPAGQQCPQGTYSRDWVVSSDQRPVTACLIVAPSIHQLPTGR